MDTVTLTIGLPLSLLALAGAFAYASTALAGPRRRERPAEQALAHELPYWELLEESGSAVLVGVDLTYTTFLALRGVDAECLDNDRLAAICASFHATVRNLPAGCLLQFIHYTDEDISGCIEGYVKHAGRSATSTFGAFLVGAKADYLRSLRGLRTHHLLVGVSALNRNQNRKARTAGFIKKFPPFTSQSHKESVRELFTLRDVVARGLEGAGILASPLDRRPLRRLLFSLLNPDRPIAERESPRRPRGAWVPSGTFREEIARSPVEERRDCLILGRDLTRVLTLRALPSFTDPAHLAKLISSLRFHARISLSATPLDPIDALDQLKRRRDQAHLLATLREKRNQEAEAQENDLLELIDSVLRSNTTLFQMSLSIAISVPGRSEQAKALLEKQTAQVIQLASSIGGTEVVVDEYGQLDEFVAMLPGGASSARRQRLCTSHNIAHLLPTWEPWPGTAKPALIVQNSRLGLIGIDPFDPSLDNANAFIAGSSGSGKSSMMNLILMNLIASGAKAIVLDVGGSYRRLIELFGGRYFAVSPEAEVDCALNPFFAHVDMAATDNETERRRSLRLQFIATVIEQMVAEPARPELRNRDRAVLAFAIEETYRRVVDRTPILSDLVEVLCAIPESANDDSAIGRELARDLRLWTTGTAGRLLNRPTTIDLLSDCAAFDLKGLEGNAHLQSVILLTLSGVIWNLVMRDPTERKAVVFDEVWRLLGSDSSAKLIDELYRTSRKYRCSIVTISQSVEDFMGSSIATALINNSASKYLLKHKSGHEAVARAFKLNKQEQEIFETLQKRQGEFTEALMFTGEHHFLARIVLSPVEYWVATTHPPDLAAEKQIERAQPELSTLDRIQILAARWPSGASTDPEKGAAIR